MKWLFLFDENHVRGGFQTCIRELATEVLEHESQVDILCLRKNPFKELQKRFPERCAILSGPFLETRSLRPSSLRAAWRILRKCRPNALFFCTTGVPNYLPFLFLARRSGIRHVIAQFGTDVAFPDAVMSRRYFGGILPGVGWWRKELIWSSRIAYRNMTLGLFNNGEQLARWQGAMGFSSERCALWNYPLDASRFHPSRERRAEVRHEWGFTADEFVIGGVGALNRQKSFDLSIRAMALLRRRLPRARLVIAGDGPLREELEQLADTLGIAEQVTFLGPRSDIHRVMNGFDLFCMPSTHPNESLGIVFVEAIASGVPIVVPGLPGPRRVAQDGKCGIVVPTGSPDALADAWLNVHDNHELRSRLIGAGLEHAKEFDRAVVYRNLMDRMEHSMHTTDSVAQIECT